MDEIHVGNIGTTFKCTITTDGSAVNVSGATTKQIIFRRPDGTTLTKTASFYTDGTDGIIMYTTIDGDLSLGGVWRIQGYIVLSPSEVYYSDIQTFKVFENL